MPSIDLETGQERKPEQRTRGLGPKPESVRLTERLFEEYEREQQEFEDQGREDDAVYNNLHFTPEQTNAAKLRGFEPIGLPIISGMVDQAVAMLTARTPSFKATGREDSDVKDARLAENLLSYVWQISEGNQQLKTALTDYYARGGRGVLHVFHDPHADFGKGDVFIKDESPFDVFPDPNARDRLCRDMAHCILRSYVTREQADAMWPEYRDIIADADKVFLPNKSRGHTRHRTPGTMLADDVADAYHDHYRVLQRYSRVLRLRWHVTDPTGPRRVAELDMGEEEFAAYAAMRVFVVTTPETPAGPGETVYVREDDGDVFEYYSQIVERLGTNPVIPLPEGGLVIVSIEEMTVATLIELGVIQAAPYRARRIMHYVSIGGQPLYENEIPSEHYPIVLINNRHNRNPYPTSDVRQVRDMQDAINKAQNVILAHAMNSSGTKLMAQKGAFTDVRAVEHKLQRPGSVVVEFNPVGERPLIPWQPVPLSSEFYVNQDRLKAQMQETLSIYPLQAGDSESAPNTLGGIIRLDEYGLRRMQSKLDDIYTALNQLARVAMDYVRAYFPVGKVIRIVDPEGVEVFSEQLNVPLYDSFGQHVETLNDTATLRYDVIFVAGSTMPASRWDQLRLAIEMYDKGLIDRIEVLKKTDLFDREGVMERLSEIAQMQQAIAQLQDELKQKDGTIQRMQNELMSKDRQVASAKGTAEIKAVVADTRAEARVMKTRMQDAFKDTKGLLDLIESAN